MRKSRPLFLGVALLSLLSACSHANSDRERPQGPPEEAFTACEGKAEGDQVSFSGREGESIDATCKEIDGQLVAVPANAPPRRGR